MPIDLIRYNNFLIYYNTQGEVRSHTEWEGEEKERAPGPKRAERRRKKDLLSHLFTRIYIDTRHVFITHLA